MVGRKQPYTQIGIRRLRCSVAGCEARAEHQWNCCANGNLWMPLCLDHDIELNRITLEWMGHPEADRLISEYEVRSCSPSTEGGE
jgi:hypothetical protein